MFRSGAVQMTVHPGKLMTSSGLRCSVKYFLHFVWILIYNQLYLFIVSHNQ